MSASPHAMMRHALGVHRYPFKGGARWKKPFRNHYVAGRDNVAAWDALVAQGFAEKRSCDVARGDPLYVVTNAGREAALAGITFKRRWGYGEPTHR